MRLLGEVPPVQLINTDWKICVLRRQVPCPPEATAAKVVTQNSWGGEHGTVTSLWPLWKKEDDSGSLQEPGKGFLVSGTESQSWDWCHVLSWILEMCEGET